MGIAEETQEFEPTLADESNAYWKEAKKDLDQLRKKPAFKRLILEVYLKDRAVDGVSMLAHPQTLEKGGRTEVMESLIAISRLQDFFNMVDVLGTSTPEPEGSDEGGLQPGDSL